MPLDSLGISSQIGQMGELLVQRHGEELLRLRLAHGLVEERAGDWQALADEAESSRDRVAVPTGSLDQHLPTPACPVAYTALATDGSEIDPDRHGAGGNFYVVNVGWATIPYGQPERTAELRNESRLGYTDEDLFIVEPGNPRRQVPVRDRHLDALRAVEELRKLADLAESESGDGPPVVALVDGTLLFSVLEDRPKDFLRRHFYGLYVKELDRLRDAGVALAAYASRTRGIDLVNLFRGKCGVEPSACATCQPKVNSESAVCCLRGLTDGALLGPHLETGERSATFRVRSNVHDSYFGEHRVYFFLLETGSELARVEMPEWVARDPDRMDLIHAVLMDQCTKGMGYPAVLARADDRAVITQADRALLNTMVRQELARRGMPSRASAKLQRKQVRSV